MTITYNVLMCCNFCVNSHDRYWNKELELLYELSITLHVLMKVESYAFRIVLVGWLCCFWLLCRMTIISNYHALYVNRYSNYRLLMSLYFNSICTALGYMCTCQLISSPSLFSPKKLFVLCLVVDAMSVFQ